MTDMKQKHVIMSFDQPFMIYARVKMQDTFVDLRKCGCLLSLHQQAVKYIGRGEK